MFFFLQLQTGQQIEPQTPQKQQYKWLPKKTHDMNRQSHCPTGSAKVTKTSCQIECSH